MDAATFIANYSAEQAALIAFAGNGNEGPKLVDANLAWRRAVLAEVLPQLDTAPLALIRALFEAETAYARAVWGVHRAVGALASSLLNRGGVAELETYLAGRAQSFDTAMACVTIRLEPAVAAALLAVVEQRLKQSRTPIERDDWLRLRSVFEYAGREY